MPETPERSPQLRELRPKAAGHVWAWIIVAVGSVIFLAIALWVIVAGKTAVDRLSDHEGIHRVSSRWAERWAQAPGPPSAYLDSAGSALAIGQHDEAMRFMAMALALEPDNAEGWHQALCLSLIAPTSTMAIPAGDRSAVIDALVAMDVAHPDLAEVRDWTSGSAAGTDRDGALPALCAQMVLPIEPKTEGETLDSIDVSP